MSAASTPCPQPRMLIILNQRFWDNSKGSSVRIRLLLSELAEKFSIDLFHLKRLSPGDVQTLGTSFPEVRHLFSCRSGLWFLWDATRAIFKKKGTEGSQPGSFEDWRISFVLRRVLKQQSYGTVLFEYIWTARFINQVTEAALPAELWVDTHDVMHQRSSSSLAAGIPAGRQISAAEESVYLSRFSRILSIQKEEEAEFRRLAPDKEVVTFPVRIKADATPYAAPAAFVAGSVHLLHVSSNDPIAVTSLKWFLESVWPEVRTRCPQVRLHLVGSICKSFADASTDAMELHGFVQNLAPFYQHSHLSINPCLAGSGIKIKTLEALAYGKTVVTTSYGAQGIDPQPRLRLVEPSLFAAALISELS